jgi:predicted DNA repair protein MutK
MAHSHIPKKEHLMAGKSFAFATIAGGITLFVLGYVFYELLLSGFFENNLTDAGRAVMLAEPKVLGIFLSNLVYATLLTLTVGTWAKASSAGEGFKVGATVGLLFALSVDIAFQSFTNIWTLNAAFVDTLMNAIMGGIAGAVIAVVVGKTSTSV